MRRPRVDEGVSLILAMVMMLIIGVAIIAISNFAVGSATTTFNLENQRAVDANAESAISIAIQYMRTTYYPSLTGKHLYDATPTPTSCMPASIATYPLSAGANGTFSGSQVIVYCEGTTNAAKNPSRQITFYACAYTSTMSANTCLSTTADQVAVALVYYDDIDPFVPTSSSTQCSPSTPVAPTTPTTCGEELSVQSMDLKSADN